MGLATKMKDMSENILSSFKQRIKENEELVNDVQKTLDQFQKDHQEMTAVLTTNAVSLRNGLANSEKERIEIYNELMSGIHADIASIQAEVIDIQNSTVNLLNEFGVDRTQMVAELNKFFAENRADRMVDEKNRMEEFDALMKDIDDDIKNINDEVLRIFKDTNITVENFEKEHADMSVQLRAELTKNLVERVEFTRALLTDFQKRLSEMSKENQKMAQRLQKDLAKGETVRLNDYNALMKGIHSAIKDIQKEVKMIQKASIGLITDYAQDRSQGIANWNHMQDEITQLRKETGVESAMDEIEISGNKKEVTIETQAEAASETLVEIQPEVEPKPEAPMKLDDKVLNYINSHKNGVRVSEMEEPLCETRMKLGFTAKALLEEGKVQKIENIYYPLH